MQNNLEEVVGTSPIYNDEKKLSMKILKNFMTT